MTAPLLETLTDDFADGVVDPVKWSNRSGVTEQNGRLEFTQGVSSVSTPTMYTLPGSGAFCRANPPAGTLSSAYLSLEVSGTVKTGPNTAQFDCIRAILNRTAGKLSWSHIKDLFTTKWTETITFDAVAHAWVQIREAGGNLLLETSPDGTAGSWTTRFTKPVPAGTLTVPGAINWAASCKYSGGTPTTPGYIGNLNVTP